MPPILMSLGLWSVALLSIVLLNSQESRAQEPYKPSSFVQIVVTRHPAVRKADGYVQAAEFGLKASGLQPNPTLTLAATAGDAGETSNALTQTFEISGQPQLRSKVATARLLSAQSERRGIKRQVAALAYRSWLALWKAHRLHELALLRKTLMDEVERVARRRFEVGEIAENEALRVELASSQADSSLVQAEATLLSADRQAALLLGLEPQNSPSVRVLMDPHPLLPEITLDDVLLSAADHPNIEAQNQQKQALLYDSELIGKERAPLLGLSIYRSNLIRTTAIEQGAQLSLSFPILDWGSIGNRKKQQNSRAEAYQSSIEEGLLKTRQELADAWSLLEAAQKRREILTIQAGRYEELAREARVAYDVGLLSLTDVLLTEGTYRQAGIELILAQSEILELEVLILERTGLNFPENLLKENS
jgi:outer membrane protein TolC